ncbi:nuclease domain-containing protein [Cellulosilyticum ruminicola]|uniref:nuclease domain-containing protein n=1 Tax=Cellulosilyticum ruminicola TaxID=425254 RepID=UPI0006D138D1|nr:nuclease domain-containing protein [Cellulosilyticum ruminicola]
MIEVPREEDINTMHCYRDARVYENSLGEYERSVVGVPFLPSNTSLVEDFLESLVDSIGQIVEIQNQKDIPRGNHYENVYNAITRVKDQTRSTN